MTNVPLFSQVNVVMSVHRLTAQNGSHVAVALNSSSLGQTGSPNVEYATKMVAWPLVLPLRYFLCFT